MKITAFAFLVVLVSCSNGKNELMTQLINNKRVTEDSINSCAYYEDKWMQKAKDEAHASHDSLKWKPMVDSSTAYFGKGHTMKGRLKEIEFSMDSLSKMK